MNIYEMYYENNKKFGFWVRRNSWGNTIAKIISIKNVTEGDDIKGKSPYFRNPKVIAEFYKKNNPDDCSIGDLENTDEISCPGTFAYTMIK